MENFIFHNPVKILFGKGQIAGLNQLISKDERILFTYGGGSIKKNGVYDQVRNQLKGYEVVEFQGIEPNPVYETLMQAVQLVKKNNITFILAVGGGSVIDGSKFIAAAHYSKSDPWNILTGVEDVKQALPLGAILTLPATGTEMNGNAVISRRSTNEKLAFSSPFVLPQFSILDPETCYSLPIEQISNGVVDAFVHIMEQYLTFPVQARVQDAFAESLLKILIDIGPKVIANPKDYDLMASFMLTTTMALNGLIGSGVPQDWSTHEIGHEITAYHGIDHARTLAIVLPGVMHIMRQYKKEKLLQYAAKVWGIENPSDNNVDQVILLTEAFFHSMQIKTRLSDYGIGKETIEKIVNRFQQRGTLMGEHQNISADIVRKILETRL